MRSATRVSSVTSVCPPSATAKEASPHITGVPAPQSELRRRHFDPFDTPRTRGERSEDHPAPEGFARACDASLGVRIFRTIRAGLRRDRTATRIFPPHFERVSDQSASLAGKGSAPAGSAQLAQGQPSTAPAGVAAQPAPNRRREVPSWSRDVTVNVRRWSRPRSGRDRRRRHPPLGSEPFASAAIGEAARAFAAAGRRAAARSTTRPDRSHPPG